MPLSDTFDSPRFGSEAAAVIARFWERDPLAQAARQVIYFWGTPSRTSVQVETIDSPPFIILEFATCCVWVIGGCHRRNHFIQFQIGMCETDSSYNTASINRYVRQIGLAAFGGFASAGMTRGKTQVVCGHSLGGAVAEFIALSMKLDGGGWGDPQCVTFGSPKPGDSLTASSARVLRLQRWMNDGDPVPRIWPERGDAIALAVVTPLNVQMAGYGTVQWHGGTVISPTRTLSAATYPDLGANNIDGSIVGWLSNLTGDRLHPHHAWAYYAQLAQIADALPQQQEFHPPATNTQEIRPPRPSINDLRRDNLFDGGEYIDRPDPEPVPGFEPTVKFWRYKKESGIFNVYFLDQFVCGCKGRGRAKRIVSGGNKFTPNYLRSAIGDSDNFRTAMENFLQLMDEGGV